MKKYVALAMQDGHQYLIGADLSVIPEDEIVEIEDFLTTKEEAEVLAYKFAVTNRLKLKKIFYSECKNKREVKRCFRRYFKYTMIQAVEVELTK